jgi:hypothetical protein
MELFYSAAFTLNVLTGNAKEARVDEKKTWFPIGC